MAGFEQRSSEVLPRADWSVIRAPKLHRLPVRLGLCYFAAMSATQVIEEIKHLPSTEQSRVLEFAFALARERQLPGRELTGLAQKMASSDNPTEVQSLREEIQRGFYGT